MAPATETPDATWWQRLARASRLAALLTVLLVLAWPIYAAVGYGLHGVAGIWSATAAGIACWLASLGALFLAAVTTGRNAVVISVLGGMALRLGIPLVFGILAKERSAVLAEGDILTMVLAYYLLALPTETWLSLKLVQRSSQQPAAKAV
ncbi:MAG TPA: hypothetical protein ENJ50_11365 [Planctomycetaceae bacterium]|nr:hypothetical protein [Planctomycetaceae bacterium]